MCQLGNKVLIVAKCNVNFGEAGNLHTEFIVLIVAKCNVNLTLIQIYVSFLSVLIVAKCNVNLFQLFLLSRFQAY